MVDPTSKTQPPTATTTIALSTVTLPRITIEFCTQCKWNLRAAYYAQELLQTFGTSLGEVSLMPATGGTFVITLYRADAERKSDVSDNNGVTVAERVIWDRKTDGGFPETKELKNRVRNVIEPGRSLGHTDRALKRQEDGAKEGGSKDTGAKEEGADGRKEECKDC